MWDAIIDSIAAFSESCPGSYVRTSWLSRSPKVAKTVIRGSSKDSSIEVSEHDRFRECGIFSSAMTLSLFSLKFGSMFSLSSDVTLTLFPSEFESMLFSSSSCFLLRLGLNGPAHCTSGAIEL